MNWLLVPAVSLAATLVGVIAVFAGSVAVADRSTLGEDALGVGVWTMAAATT